MSPVDRAPVPAGSPHRRSTARGHPGTPTGPAVDRRWRRAGGRGRIVPGANWKRRCRSGLCSCAAVASLISMEASLRITSMPQCSNEPTGDIRTKYRSGAAAYRDPSTRSVDSRASVIWSRPVTPSLRYTRSKCESTVRFDTMSRSAIPLLLKPPAASIATSRSRAVSGSTPLPRISPGVRTPPASSMERNARWPIAAAARELAAMGQRALRSIELAGGVRHPRADTWEWRRATHRTRARSDDVGGGRLEQQGDRRAAHRVETDHQLALGSCVPQTGSDGRAQITEALLDRSGRRVSVGTGARSVLRTDVARRPVGALWHRSDSERSLHADQRGNGGT